MEFYPRLSNSIHSVMHFFFMIAEMNYGMHEPLSTFIIYPVILFLLFVNIHNIPSHFVSPLMVHILKTDINFSFTIHCTAVYTPFCFSEIQYSVVLFYVVLYRLSSYHIMLCCVYLRYCLNL